MDCLTSECLNEKLEVDEDSCFEDGTKENHKKMRIMENAPRDVQLLDLSDDVLLFILKLCSPRDLKALGYTCERLGTLICDHTLWQNIDMRDWPVGAARLQWLLTNVLHSGTKELLLSGFARENNGCLKNAKNAEETNKQTSSTEQNNINTNNINNEKEVIMQNPPERQGQTSSVCRQHARLHIAPRQLARYTATCTRTPNGEQECSNDTVSNTCECSDNCPGPQYSVTQSIFKALKTQCPNLTSLALEYCNINYNATGLNYFPSTLKKLSLRGVQFYNLPMDKSVLFNIQTYMPELEYLDLSECDWLEPLCMLTLSKLPNLRQLLMRDCHKMSEFVAYASLATRYGFFKLQVLDLRGTPVGDSEVSALGWLPELQELYLSPAEDPVPESTQFVNELEPWELEEPDYFKWKYQELSENDTTHAGNENNETVGSLAAPKMASRVVISLMKNFNQESAENPGVKRKNDVENGDSKCDDDQCLKKRKKGNEDNEEPSTSNTKDGSGNEKVSTKEVDKESNEEPSTSNKEENHKLNPKITVDVYIGNGNQGSSQLKSDTNEPSTSENKSFDNESNENLNNTNNLPSTSNSNQNGSNSFENSSNSQEGNQRTDGSQRLFPEDTPIFCVDLGTRRTEVLSNNNRYRFIPINQGSPQDCNHLLPLRQPHMDPAALVTDAAILRFGRADGVLNVTIIGPCANVVHNSRPDRSNLRILSVTGFRDITNRSLVHLATAAPHLRSIDFRGTKVTARGVETFRSLRPDCEVLYSDDN